MRGKMVTQPSKFQATKPSQSTVRTTTQGTGENSHLIFEPIFEYKLILPGGTVGLAWTCNWKAVPRRARVQVSWTFVSLNSRLESNKEEEERTSSNSTSGTVNWFRRRIAHQTYAPSACEGRGNQSNNFKDFHLKAKALPVLHVPCTFDIGVLHGRFISHNVSINWFQQVNNPTKSSSYCLLLLIKILS